MKILIPLDGSKFSEAVLKPAAELVKSTGAEVYLLQVVKPSEGTVNWGQHHNIEPHAAMPGPMSGMEQADVGSIAVESKGQADERLRQNALDYLEHIIHGNLLCIRADQSGRGMRYGSPPTLLKLLYPDMLWA